MSDWENFCRADGAVAKKRKGGRQCALWSQLGQLLWEVKGFLQPWEWTESKESGSTGKWAGSRKHLQGFVFNRSQSADSNLVWQRTYDIATSLSLFYGAALKTWEPFGILQLVLCKTKPGAFILSLGPIQELFQNTKEFFIPRQSCLKTTLSF